MDTIQTVDNQPFGIINTCFNAIEASIEHFVSMQGHIEKLAVLLQEGKSKEHNGSKKVPEQPENYEPLCISKINYIAILALEKLNISSPSQKQIDTMESIILLSMKPGRPNQEKPQFSVCNSTIAGRILQRSLRNNCK